MERVRLLLALFKILRGTLPIKRVIVKKPATKILDVGLDISFTWILYSDIVPGCEGGVNISKGGLTHQKPVKPPEAPSAVQSAQLLE